jgi:hypothetical protein
METLTSALFHTHSVFCSVRSVQFMFRIYMSLHCSFFPVNYLFAHYVFIPFCPLLRAHVYLNTTLFQNEVFRRWNMEEEQNLENNILISEIITYITKLEGWGCRTHRRDGK